MTTASIQRLTPPRRRDRLIAWVVLAGCLVLAAAVLLTDLGRPPVTRHREARAVAVAVQTDRRQEQFKQEGWSYERMTPFRDGLPQLDQPPGRTWLHLLATATLGDEAPIDEHIYRARLVSTFFVLLTIAAAFWAGMAIGNVVTAAMAALICLSMPMLMVYGRFATSEAVGLGLTMLSIASALWAIRPLRPPPSLMRQGFGWCVCGLALGTATLTIGPATLPTALVPILIMLLLAPHRVGHVLGLVAAVLIASLMVTPWAGYAHLREPEAWRAWVTPMLPELDQNIAGLPRVFGQRLLILVIGVAPWTLWLITAILQPFSTSSAGSRNRLFIGWAWFVTTTVLLALAPGRATGGSMLSAIAAASVMLGQLFRHGADLSAEGRHARFWRWLRWPQWGAMLAVSLIVPGIGMFQDTLIERGWLPGPVFAPLHWMFWAGTAAASIGVLIISLGAVVKHYPVRAVVWWSVWSAMMMGLTAIPLARGPLVHSEVRADSAQLAAAVGDHPVLYLTDLPAPNPVLRLYADRDWAPVTEAQMHRLAEQMGELYLLTPRSYEPGDPWRRELDLSDYSLTLWRRPPLQELAP